jgi:hypothetical protein
MLVRRPMAIWCAAAALAMLTFLAATTSPAGAQAEGEVGINFVAFACPNLEADLYGECDILTGATFEILADGVPVAGSPFTTAPTSLVPGFFFYAPANATLTVTELSVDPPGNAPAPGFDPLVINVADIPIGGCGGESTCPTIEFVNLPFAIADGPAGEPPTAAEVDVLPATGSGYIPVQQSLPWLSLALGVLCAGFALSRRAEPLAKRIDGSNGAGTRV